LARLYFDHNVSRHVGPFLLTTGHDLLFTRDPGSAQLTDDAHLLSSVRADRVLITHDRADFKMLHNAWLTWPAAFGMALPAHPGILVLDSAPPQVLAGALSAFLASTPPERLRNVILWWHRHDGWRQPSVQGRWERYQPGAEDKE
jgi:hypothetical protein